MHLEQKLTKQKIFEYYANQVPLGQRGSFGIRGFGEAAQVYFGKDFSRLTLPEAATLAGLIQQPSYHQSVPLAGAGARTPQRRAEGDAREQIHRRRAIRGCRGIAAGARAA